MESREVRARLLDVTLRDGGWLNYWQFSELVIRDVLRALAKCRIGHVEIGYIGTDASPPLLRCSHDFIAGIRRDFPSIGLVAMMRCQGRSLTSIEHLLSSRVGAIDTIRLTSPVGTVLEALAVAHVARGLGFCCSINLTSVTGEDPSEISRAVHVIADSGAVDWLYLADSRGALYPDEAKEMFHDVRKLWPYFLGFHGHNNIGNALENTRVAIEMGFDLVDGSLGGHGLGGGNTDTLSILQLIHGMDAGVETVLRTATRGIERQLPGPSSYAALYRLSGEKNLEQEWVPEVARLFGSASTAFLESLPRRRYQSIDSVLGLK